MQDSEALVALRHIGLQRSDPLVALAGLALQSREPLIALRQIGLQRRDPLVTLLGLRHRCSKPPFNFLESLAALLGVALNGGDPTLHVGDPLVALLHVAARRLQPLLGGVQRRGQPRHFGNRRAQPFARQAEVPLQPDNLLTGAVGIGLCAGGRLCAQPLHIAAQRRDAPLKRLARITELLHLARQGRDALFKLLTDATEARDFGAALLQFGRALLQIAGERGHAAFELLAQIAKSRGFTGQRRDTRLQLLAQAGELGDLPRAARRLFLHLCQLRLKAGQLTLNAITQSLQLSDFTGGALQPIGGFSARARQLRDLGPQGGAPRLQTADQPGAAHARQDQQDHRHGPKNPRRLHVAAMFHRLGHGCSSPHQMRRRFPA